jgi:hypothetical protein
MTSRTAIATIALLVALLLAGAQPAAAAEQRVRAVGSSGEGYWTGERMRAARPLELVRGGERMAGRLRAGQAPDFLSGEVTAPTTPPNNTNGRLFGVLKGFGQFSCSATSVDSRSGTVILTAGHCLYEPGLRRFAKRVAFVPAYTDGEAPFGAWAASRLAVTRAWARHANSNFDFAAVALRKGPNGETIQGTVGGRELALNAPVRQNYAAYGYPANLMEAERMWACGSPYVGRDPRPFRVGKAPVAIGCDMTAGASGGGWIGESGSLVSVSSFGYRQYPDVLFGPRLGAAAAKLVKRVAR